MLFSWGQGDRNRGSEGGHMEQGVGGNSLTRLQTGFPSHCPVTQYLQESSLHALREVGLRAERVSL